MKWIEITAVSLTPNPVNCGAATLLSVTVTEKERFLTVTELNAMTVGRLNTQRVDLFAGNGGTP